MAALLTDTKADLFLFCVGLTGLKEIQKLSSVATIVIGFLIYVGNGEREMYTETFLL